jgi:hypothetical protein
METDTLNWSRSESRIGSSTLIVAAALLVCASDAIAQIPRPPEPDAVRVRLGPLWLNPTLALTNAGVDTNVFNESDADDPKRDVTLTLSPRSDVWLRAGRTWITGNVREEMVWYEKYVDERSLNTGYGVAWIVPLTRVSLMAGGSWLNTRERPGFEIDARAPRHDRTFNGAAEVRVMSRTLLGVRGERRKVDFDDNASFLGRDLHAELNRTETAAALTVRHEVTPLTTIALDIGRSHDRFELSPERDAQSTRVGVAVELDPFALISGRAQIGYREFKPDSADVPGYTGTIASIDLAYVALGSTKLTVQAIRDVQYSFDLNQPYYLQTGVSGSVAQQIYGPLDVQARVGTQHLAYRNRTGIDAAITARVDRVRAYGFGIGYHLGRDVRVGFNIDQQTRRSELDRRRYEGRTYGMALTYGLQ